MKKSHIILSIALAALTLTGCEQEIIDQQFGQYCIKLNLFTSDIKLTRASGTAAGIDALNENYINTVDYFIYSNDVTTSNNNAYKKGHFTVNSDDEGGTVINLTQTEFESLFPKEGDDCKIFIIANLPSSTTIPQQNTSIDNLKAIAIKANFTTQRVQDSFVMMQEGKITRGADNKASGTLELDRVAAKLSLEIGVVDKFVEDRGNIDPLDDITWKPVPKDMKIELKQVAELSNVGGSVDAADADNIKDYGKSSFQVMKTEGGDNVTYSPDGGTTTFTKYNVKEGPWYSYPREWPDDDDVPTAFLITLPWSTPITGGTRVQKCYYKIMLNENQLTSGNWYHIIAELKVLGSFYEDDPTLILPDNLVYYAVPWKNGIGSGFNTDAYIKDAGYLTVSSNLYTLDNVNSIVIPYSSSAVCEVNPTCKYNKWDKENNTWKLTELPKTEYSISCDDGNITLEHVLKNEMPKEHFTIDDFDLSDFTFTIELYHRGDKAHYCEEITVVQHPALVLDYDNNNVDKKDNKVTVFVNKGHQSGSATGTSPSWTNVTNNTYNGYMYGVTVSRSDKYQIGDPRQTTPVSARDMGMNDNTTTIEKERVKVAPAFYVDGTYYSNPTDHTRELLYYYPTDPQKSGNIIAPKFRIASENANCASYYATMDEVKWRCATYQEFGYPAGRWRVPTAAELNYIGRLCANDVIPTIFSSTGYYWAADGVYKYDESSGSMIKTEEKKATRYSKEVGGLSRCVYDEWYWEQSDYATLSHDTGVTPNDRSFVWGDMPRNKFK